LNIEKNIKNIAQEVLLNESRVIENLIQLIDNDFDTRLKEIYSSKGRVVVTGIGKRAIIANKIANALNSAGTPSLFMHAPNALQGDLDKIFQEDVVICISTSGNTPEIRLLVLLLKRSGFKLVALLSNPNSYLAQYTDYIVEATGGEEVYPINQLTTTNTMAHLVQGDILAISLLEHKSFTSDFATFNPGGALGEAIDNNQLTDFLHLKDFIRKSNCTALYTCN
jgi:arabinose-5-phosphate isomerase